MYIYKITNKINGRIYIGQTTKSIEYRWKYHCYPSNSCPYLANAIQKYKKENFKIEILEKIKTKKELNDREIYWISKLNSLKPNGYNIQTGGGITDSMRGQKHSIEARKKMSEKAKGINNSQFGKKGNLSPNYGKKQTKSHKLNNGLVHRKPIYCIELDKYYLCGKYAAEELGINGGNISKVAKGIYKQTKGYSFVYLNGFN